jgi:FAD/FMN-containing dehydrogenase
VIWRSLREKFVIDQNSTNGPKPDVTRRALQRISRVRQPQKLPQVLSVEEVERLLASSRNPKHRAALAVAYGAGLRASEVVHLKIADIDSERMIVRVVQGKGSRDRRGGALLAHLDSATLPHSLVTTAGVVSHTGVGGFTLGGGFGRLNRKYGLAVDNLLSAQIITADGQIRTVSKDQDADLFWAIRGGGGNFGVTGQFEFQLHPFERNLLSGMIDWPLAQARDVLEFYGDWYQGLSDNLYVGPAMMTMPDGTSVIAMEAVYAGDPARVWFEQLEPFTGGYYDNIQADTSAPDSGSFGPAHTRLAKIKGRYDPGNQFRLNRNIKPAV